MRSAAAARARSVGISPDSIRATSSSRSWSVRVATLVTVRPLLWFLPTRKWASAKPAICGLQQDGAAVRAAMVDVEACHEAFSKQVGKQTLCRGRLGHVKASCLVGRSCRNAFLPRGGFSFSRIHE